MRPGILTNDDPTGKISTTPATAATSKIARADVAAAVVAVVKHPLPKQIIEIVNGDTPVVEAIK